MGLPGCTSKTGVVYRGSGQHDYQVVHNVSRRAVHTDPGRKSRVSLVRGLLTGAVEVALALGPTVQVGSTHAYHPPDANGWQFSGGHEVVSLRPADAEDVL
jgi:hypothetical protein